MHNRLREIRKRAGFTQEQLGEKVGVSKFHINRIENGKHSPSVSLSVRIASVLGVRVDDIFFN